MAGRRVVAVGVLLAACVLPVAIAGAADPPGKLDPKATGQPAPKPGAPAPVAPGIIPPVQLTPIAPPPRVTGYAPARVVPGATVAVLGENFGQASKERAVRVGGEGYGRALAATSWTPGRIEVRLPADVRPGRYYVGIVDARGQWITNLERSLEVVDPLRRLPVRLEVQIGCSYDVLTTPPSVGLQLGPATGAGGEPVVLTLRAHGSRPGPRGAVIWEYTGTVEVAVGSYRAAGGEGRFTLDFWDYINGNAVPVPGGRYIERTNWEDCEVHRRVTSRGTRLPGPERQTLGVRLSPDLVNVAADTAGLSLAGHPGQAGLGSGSSLPTPTPIDVR